MSTLIVTLIGAGTLAFGAVYAWAYVPLLAAAAVIGLWGLRRGLVPSARPLAAALLLVWLAVGAQLVPLPRALVDRLSPSTAALSASYNLLVPGAAAGRLPLSIDPASTQAALLGMAALGVYLLGLPTLLHGRSLRALPRALAIFMVPVALFGIYHREYGNNLVYWFWHALEGSRAIVFGPFINPNHYGGWIVMTLPLLVGWLLGQIERAVTARRARGVRLTAWLSSAEANGIVLMTCAVLVGAVSLFWTLSRSAMLSFGAATLAVISLALARRRLGGAGRTAGVAVVVLVLLAAVIRRGPLQLVDWFQENNLASRVDAWRDGWDVIRAFPWTGTGLNTYSVAMLFYQTRNREYYMTDAHNDYVQLLAEGGALVAIPAAAAIVVLAWVIRRNLRAARAEARGYWIRAGAAVGLLAIGVQETLEYSLQIPVNALLFCTLAAIALTPATGGSGGPPGPRDTIHERP